MNTINLGTLSGQILDDKYQLEGLIGQGGMGAVFRATHLGIKRPVAVKIIAPRYITNQEVRLRFRREAEAAGRILHPNVVNVTDYGIAKVGPHRIAFLVMEYLEGISLGNFLKQMGQLPLALTLDIVEQTSLGLGHAHRQGVIHRDLKPDNIWLQPDGRGAYIVKVLDFGLAKLRDPTARDPEGAPNHPDAELQGSNDATVLSEQLADASADIDKTIALSPSNEQLSDTHFSDNYSSPEITQVGSVLGTPVYMSPEQCSGKVLDARSDIYSLGVITFHMLAGKPPFTGNMAAIIHQHIAKIPPPLQESRPDVHRSLARHLLLAMGKDPAQRPNTPESFAATLKLVGEGEGPVLRQAETTYRSSPGLFFGISLMALLPFGSAALLLKTLLPEVNSPIMIIGYFLVNLVLGSVATTVISAGCALAVGTIRKTRGRHVRQKYILVQVLKNQPVFWYTAITSVSRVVFNLSRFINPGLKEYVDSTLLPSVVALENLRGSVARKQARDLVAPVRSLASSLRAREFGLMLVLLNWLWVFIIAIIRIEGISREDMMQTLWSDEFTFYVGMGWALFLWTYPPLSGLPAVEFYYRSRQLISEFSSEPPLPTHSQPTKRGRASRWSKSTLAWLIIPVVMILAGMFLVFGAASLTDESRQSLVFAVENNQKADVDRLLASGTDPSTGRLRGKSALMLAAADGQVETVQALLKAGADVRFTNEEGKSALTFAAEMGHFEVVNILLESCASIADSRAAADTALIAAVKRGRRRIVARLLEAGADVAGKDNHGRTALSYANEKGHANIAKQLRNPGAK